MIRNLLVNWKSFLVGILVGAILSGILAILLPIRIYGDQFDTNTQKSIQVNSDTESSYKKATELFTGNTPGTTPIESKININSASLEELTGLPGIGDSKARSILEYREKYGYFHDINELLYIPGIGENLLKEISQLISVQ